MKQSYLTPETETLVLQTEHSVLDPMSPFTTIALLQSNMSAESATLYDSGNEVKW